MTDQQKHKGLYAALAAAQAEMGRAVKDSNNPHFKTKYADLASVMDACMTSLSRHGIAVLQPPYDDETGRYVKTIFVHGETGETMEARTPLIVNKNDMQGYGSAVTYARRYGLMGMAMIAADDDDGNAATQAPPRQDAPRVDPAPEPREDTGPTTRQIADRIITAAHKAKGDKAALTAAWGEHRDAMANLHDDLFAECRAAFAEAAPKPEPAPNADLGGDEIPF